MKLMFIILFILFIGIPLLKEEMEIRAIENHAEEEATRHIGLKTD